MSKELSPMDQARQEVPRAWYQMDHKVHIASAMIYSLGLYFANLELFHVDSIPAHVVAASIFFISNLADRYTTFKAFKSSDLAREHGVDLYQGSLEQNILLRDITNSRQFLFSKRALAIDIFATSVAAVYPAIGVGVALAKVHATASNLRVNKRFERAIEIADIRNNQDREF